MTFKETADRDGDRGNSFPSQGERHPQKPQQSLEDGDFLLAPTARGPVSGSANSVTKTLHGLDFQLGNAS